MAVPIHELIYGIHPWQCVKRPVHPEQIGDGAHTVHVSEPQLLDPDHRRVHGSYDLRVGHTAFSLISDYPVYL